MIYRPDIDGLRAIAVSTVILFHFGVPGFSGGFVGVDVFFVLSGYLIGSLIFEQLSANRFSFVSFYFRRVRRLFPVYLVVILITIIVSYFLLLPREFRDFGQSIIASSVYLSNILFYMEDGYFDTASHLKPLLHTWSLSVEEQFYLIFPALAVLLYKKTNSLMFPIFVFLTLVSLISAQVYLSSNSSAVFYLYPFRAWEMFIGVCFALKGMPAIQSKRMGGVLSVVGLVMILVPVVLYTDATPFPGFSAFLPCLGTCLIIHSGKDHLSFVHKILKTAIPVFIGKISYSLYLWHWPIFVLYMYDKSDDASVQQIVLLLAATILASVISWRFVETPFRTGSVLFSKKPSSVFSMTFICSLLLIGAGYYFHKTNGLIERFDEDESRFVRAAYDLHRDMGNCFDADNEELPGIRHCVFGDPLNSESYTLVWGDSHAGAFKKGLEDVFGRAQLPVLIAWDGGCPPLFDIAKDESVSSSVVDQQCTDRNAAVRELLREDARINAVVLIGRWSYYINGGGIGIDAENKVQIDSQLNVESGDLSDVDVFVNAFVATTSELKNNGREVFVVEQVPEFENYKARVLALGLIKNDSEILDNFDSLTTIAYQEIIERQRVMQDVLANEAMDTRITILRTHERFCNDERCSLLINDEPAIYDNNHISSTGALKISEIFNPVVSFIESSKVTN